MAAQQYGQWLPTQQHHPPGHQSQQEPFLPQSEGLKTDVTALASEVGNESRKESFRQKWFGGIRRTLRAFAFVAALVLISNISWLIYARQKYGIGKSAYGTIKKGFCEDVKHLNTWLHFAINILSTLLLTGSNAFMAAFCCPSRKEVDRAHSRGKWMHVGSFSLGNLRGIAKRKALVVTILALSSIPFHLLYNSMVFESLSANEYAWAVVTEDFLSGSPFNTTNATPTDWYVDPSVGAAENIFYKGIQTNASSWERLDSKACIQAYSNIFLSDRRNVVLVSSVTNTTNSILDHGDTAMTSDFDGNWWICSLEGQDGGNLKCNPEDYVSKASSWTVFDYPIEYCLSERTENICSVEFSETIMWIVLSFNLLKVVLMIWVLFRYDAEKILTSVGDAAKSFLQTEDQTTHQMCLTNKRELQKFWQSRGLAKPFGGRRSYWGEAVSRKRWLLFFSLMIFSFLAVLFFGVWGFVHVKDRGIGIDLGSLWRLGFGAINQNAMVLYGTDGRTTPLVMAILANIPQIFLSAIYLMYMGIMTSMFLAADWSVFAHKGQTLMVSSPVGDQRGTWLLGAPLSWGIALLVLQTLLHWFVSQSIFVIQIIVYDRTGAPEVPPSDYSFEDFSHITNCGYSPIAIIVSVITAGILLLSAIVFCWRRFPRGAPPVVSTCSAAISAACHPIHRREELVFGNLKWGVAGTFPNGAGHCSMVSEESWNAGYAWAPLEGYTYAGLPDELYPLHC